jgi:hypothetical protein
MKNLMEATEAKTDAEPKAASSAGAGGCAVQSGARRYQPWFIGAVVLGVALALYLRWDWLAAAGVASFLVAAAPCLAMCAFGLCMRGKSKSEASRGD